MITKTELESIIEKYHLNGLIESVKWDISEDNVLKINFTSPNKEMVGKISFIGFPLPKSSVGVYNTSQLDKLLSITNGDLTLEYYKENNSFTKLLINDDQYKLDYALADTFIIPKHLEYTGEEEYDVCIELNKETISSLINAKNALQGESNVLIKSNQETIDFIFGGDTSYTNKITYSIKQSSLNKFSLIYNSDIIKDVLNSNKQLNNGELYINKKGVIKLYFDHGNLKSTYYLVAKEN